MKQFFAKTIAYSLLAPLLYIQTTTVKADPTGYVNLEVGANYWDIDFLEDDVSLGLAGALGLRLNSLASIELGYQNFGSINFISPTAEGELEIESFSGSLIIHVPFSEKLKGYVQAGIEEVDYTEQSTAPTFDFEKSTESYFGVGFLLTKSESGTYKLTLASHADGDVIRLSIGGNLNLATW